MKGTSATTFDPNSCATRAAMATVLYRMAGSPQVTGSNPFTDVKEGTWYTEAVNWAYENGIVKGVTEELFAPNRAITRQEAATMIYRFSKAYLGADASDEADLSSFPRQREYPALRPPGHGLGCGAGNHPGQRREIETPVPGPANRAGRHSDADPHPGDAP